jgi:hypothetical protein
MAMLPTIAPSTSNPKHPPRIQTKGLVFVAVAGPTAGGGAPGPAAAIGGDAGVTGGGAGAPGGWAALPGAGAPQLPQNGPCTWAPHVVQNGISPPEALRYENWAKLARVVPFQC